jgi:hypothetical protein
MMELIPYSTEDYGAAIIRAAAHGTVTIANAASISEPFQTRQFAQGGFMLPATFTGTAMTFEVSIDGTTFEALHDSSGTISLTVAQGKAYALPAALFAFPYAKLKSGSTESGQRTITVVLKS